MAITESQITSGNDFGFSFVDDDAIKKKIDENKTLVQTANQANDDLQKRLDLMLSTITPFLKNLAANPEKAYINWPNRDKKINEFLDKLTRIAKGQ